MDKSKDINRRKFVKMFTLGATFSCAAVTGMGRLFAEISLAATPGTGIINLKLSSFPILANENGRLRLGFSPLTTSVRDPRPTSGSGTPQEYYPFYVTRAPDQGGLPVFHAFSSQCTHAGTVTGISTTPGQLLCPNHGSRYRVDGSVSQGPASRPLSNYSIEYDGEDALRVEIPGLGYTLDGRTLQSGVGDRFEIEFRAQRNVEYEIVMKQGIGSDWEVASFAESEDAAADQTLITGDGLFKKVYVDQSGGAQFFAVRMVVGEK